MMRIYSLLLFGLMLPAFVRAQCAPPEAEAFLFGNEMQAMIKSGGDGFWGSKFYDAALLNQASPLESEALWLGGKTPDGHLRVAAQTFGRRNGQHGYHPGPLPQGDGPLDSAFCAQWDRLWSVRGMDIMAHIADFEDNGIIDEPIDAILQWPARGNPHFLEQFGFELPEDENGLAPFADLDEDGWYEPMEGDYPAVEATEAIPSQIIWTVFNDAQGQSSIVDTPPMNMEVQRTVWTLGCGGTALDRTIFVDFKVINRSLTTLDSMHLAIFDSFNIGCSQVEYVGSSPDHHAFFTYDWQNTQPLECGQSQKPGFGENPPVLATVFLSHPLTSFTYHNLNKHSEKSRPKKSQHCFNYMTARWRDGTPLTAIGDGYGDTEPITSFAFYGNPNNLSEWSMRSETIYNDYSNFKGVGSTWLGSLAPGEAKQVHTARLYVREPGFNHLENVNAMYGQLETLHEGYADRFAAACEQQICEADCVWPGDTNKDGIVNQYDLLPIAAWQGTMGPERSGFFWAPQPAAPWSGTQVSGQNLKHADANGDGTIDLQDARVCGLNLGEALSGYVPPAPDYPSGPDLFIKGFGHAPPWRNVFSQVNQLANNLNIDLREIPGLAGLAFTLEFDTGYIKNISTFYLDEDFFPIRTEPDRTLFYRERIEEGAIDIAVARPDESVPLSGEIIKVFLSLLPEEDLPGDQVEFRIKNPWGIKFDGTYISLGANTRTFFTEEQPVLNDNVQIAPLNLFPNPTTGQLHVQFPGQQVEQLEVWNSTGQSVRRAQGPFSEQHTLDLSGLPAGLYTLRARMETGMRVEKVVVR
ncbi:MAG: T9SS type A sorting domain-containing protein [bacterium]|nr:T9SS type A sorting domain-containing protein [bacterium]